MMAFVTLAILAALAAYRYGYSPLQRLVRWLLALLVLQAATGISNVVFDWPLLAAVLHTGGAGAMVTLLVWLLATTQSQSRAERALAFSRRLTE
jgi:cytochrome c oxidase assembly protein subunit 15